MPSLLPINHILLMGHNEKGKGKFLAKEALKPTLH